MKATRENVQTQLKILKNIIETPNLPLKRNIFSKKTMFLTLKVLRIQYGGYPMNLQAEPKILKKLLKHHIYQSGRKSFQKKYV
jgi:hypothetical protein